MSAAWSARVLALTFYRKSTEFQAEFFSKLGAVRIPKAMFDSVVPTLPDLVQKQCGRFHYTFAVKSLMVMMIRWRQRHGLNHSVRFVFDTITEGADEIRSFFEEMDSRNPSAMETHVMPRAVAEKPNSGSFALSYPLFQHVFDSRDAHRYTRRVCGVREP
jgi:hypothetical protein